jgi:hypothetical protein
MSSYLILSIDGPELQQTQMSNEFVVQRNRCTTEPSYNRTVVQVPEGARPSAMNQGISPLVADPVERAKVFKWIVDVLANDGYLVEQDGRWRFRSGLLRRYWVRHVV